MKIRSVRKLFLFVVGLAMVASACSSSGSTDAGANDTSNTDGTEAGETDDSKPDKETELVADLEGQELTVALTNDYLPFNFIDAETGEPDGWDYAVLDEICDRLNCTYEVQTFDFDPTIQAVADGQFDLSANGITITEERAKVIEFSNGYINVEQRIMVQESDTEIAGLEDLEASDCTVGAQIGTTNFDKAVELVGEDRIQSFDEPGVVIASLISGDVCAMIIDETAGQGFVGENADKLKLVGDSLESAELGMVFAQGSDLVEPFNQALEAMRADGTLDVINEEYLSNEFEGEEQAPEETE